MQNNQERKTNQAYWNKIWSRKQRLRLPSRLFISSDNIFRLLEQCMSPGMNVLEIGCAPGKILAWAAIALKVRVSGLDYSESGINISKELLLKLGISGDLRCEDVFETSFAEGCFDCVYSLGVIEHFSNPEELVRIHFNLLKPGGKALVIIPNYGGIYGRMQKYFDPENLALHNLEIMSPAALKKLLPQGLVENVRGYPSGRFSLMLILDKKLPIWLARSLTFCLSVIGHLQPCVLPALCPLLVLEFSKPGKRLSE